jgi:hypothetical protein
MISKAQKIEQEMLSKNKQNTDDLRYIGWFIFDIRLLLFFLIVSIKYKRLWKIQR